MKVLLYQIGRISYWICAFVLIITLLQVLFFIVMGIGRIGFDFNVVHDLGELTASLTGMIIGLLTAIMLYLLGNVLTILTSDVNKEERENQTGFLEKVANIASAVSKEAQSAADKRKPEQPDK